MTRGRKRSVSAGSGRRVCWGKSNKGVPPCHFLLHPRGRRKRKSAAGRQSRSAFPCPSVRAGYTFLTLDAFFPLGPEVTSNSTFIPSVRERKPSPAISLKWTKISSPSSGVTKPHPFASLNHFTVPVAIPLVLLCFFLQDGERFYHFPRQHAIWTAIGFIRRRGMPPGSASPRRARGRFRNPDR